jgi:hypothetical protein
MPFTLVLSGLKRSIRMSRFSHVFVVAEKGDGEIIIRHFNVDL